MQEYIKPELLVLIPVLNVLGAIIKRGTFFKDKYIPLILGISGILLSVLYVVSTEGFTASCVFVAITQGLLCAGASVYISQLIKQTGK